MCCAKSTNNPVWGTWDYDCTEEVRPDFWGTRRISPITGKSEFYYANWKRYPKYIFSISISGIILTFAFGVMTISLNLQGYIHDKESILFIPSFDKHSRAGGLFDANSQIMWLVPTLGHSICILIINMFYEKVARRLTAWENHRTHAEFENALITKRFVFEFLDAYMPLFYIAFYQRDINNLRMELTSLYMSDEIRRVGIETLLPLAFSWKMRPKDNGKSASIDYQTKLDENDVFNDYLEMVVQFGYVTLFASAMPLAATLSLVSNIIEVQSDMYRLTRLSRRPRSERTNGIGTWRVLLEIMCWTSILTNCFIFAFCSDQLQWWFPESMSTKPDLEDSFVPGMPDHLEYLAILVFTTEHGMGLIFIVIKFLIPDMDDETETRVKRIKYIEHKALRKRLELEDIHLQTSGTSI